MACNSGDGEQEGCRQAVAGSWSNERGAANATAACASNGVGAPAWISCPRQPSQNRASHLLAAGMRAAWKGPKMEQADTLSK